MFGYTGPAKVNLKCFYPRRGKPEIILLLDGFTRLMLFILFEVITSAKGAKFK